MKVVEKYFSDFKGFDWLNAYYLPSSDAFKFEVYFDTATDRVPNLISKHKLLFHDYLDQIVIRPFPLDNEWGNYCIDTWDIENDSYDYSPDNKQEPTASYLSMLRDNNIEANYIGFCKCYNWDKFLHTTLHCLLSHVAPYGFIFHVPDEDFVFYYHHTESIGVYYKQLNNAVLDIIKKSQSDNSEIRFITDQRVKTIIESGNKL